MFAPVDIGRLARDSAAPFAAAVERAGLQLELDIPDDGTMIEADADMVEKILLNLLSNATKFTFEGTITLRVRVGEQVELEVADTGAGIPEDELPRLFERFHRIHGARARSHEGSGIGLALVHELVELHGGEVAVTAPPGRAARSGSCSRSDSPARTPPRAPTPPRRRRSGADSARRPCSG